MEVSCFLGVGLGVAIVVFFLAVCPRSCFLFYRLYVWLLCPRGVTYYTLWHRRRAPPGFAWIVLYGVGVIRGPNACSRFLSRA